MTDQELLGLARQGLNMAKRDRRDGKLHVVLANYYEGRGMHRMKMVEDLLIHKLGEDWLDNGRKKDYATSALRMGMRKSPMPPDAFIMTTATNMFKTTKKWEALPPEEKNKLVHHTGHDDHHRMVKEGLLSIMDSFTAIVQTPDRVCMCVQEVDHGQFVGEPQARYFAQSEFGGRFKMFGKEAADFEVELY